MHFFFFGVMMGGQKKANAEGQGSEVDGPKRKTELCHSGFQVLSE